MLLCVPVRREYGSHANTFIALMQQFTAMSGDTQRRVPGIFGRSRIPRVGRLTIDGRPVFMLAGFFAVDHQLMFDLAAGMNRSAQ